MLGLLLGVLFLLPLGLLAVGLVAAPPRHAELTPLLMWYVCHVVFVYFFLCWGSGDSQYPWPFSVPTLGLFQDDHLLLGVRIAMMTQSVFRVGWPQAQRALIASAAFIGCARLRVEPISRNRR